MEMDLHISLFEARVLTAKRSFQDIFSVDRGCSANIRQDVQDFDVEHVRCSTEENKHQLKAVIDAGGPGLTQQLIKFVQKNF